jgi:hypothetical protein
MCKLSSIRSVRELIRCIVRILSLPLSISLSLFPSLPLGWAQVGTAVELDAQELPLMLSVDMLSRPLPVALSGSLSGRDCERNLASDSLAGPCIQPPVSFITPLRGRVCMSRCVCAAVNLASPVQADSTACASIPAPHPRPLPPASSCAHLLFPSTTFKLPVPYAPTPVPYTPTVMSKLLQHMNRAIHEGGDAFRTVECAHVWLANRGIPTY